MSDVFMLTQGQLNRIKPYFSVSYGIPRVNDARVISGITPVRPAMEGCANGLWSA